ncbi:hypothetical protein MOQ72_30345 [Saccharopolyspora sp. K220]|uniref:hypothetical protein n=1 Tax=Saccharopolyspora soli TaxID=2926618 RepID=UPI001F55B755|nr:hypothetical protein [Saccharopolyspora soli]MCI2421745.1 hypothetical protein [Saccharopolyspora soli]
MRARSELIKWGLLVVLALCVVLMHHVPAQHDQAHPPAAVATHSAMAAEHSAPSPMPDHGLLHLCLAIAAGFVLLLLPLLRRIASALAEPSRLLMRTALEQLRPPTPVPRRLAVLCVLRR